MLDYLRDILCAILNLGAIIIDLLVAAINALIVAIGVALAFFITLLPTLPDAPDPPDSGVLAILNWFIPVVPLLAFATTAIGLWVTFLLIKIALNWLRAL
jgi:hypothetical protein